MTDYECPSCGGGFPASDADGECPWCGEAMAGSDGDAPIAEPVRQPQPIPDIDPPTRDGDLDLGPHFQPVTPHWDSGIRVGTATDTVDGIDRSVGSVQSGDRR